MSEDNGWRFAQCFGEKNELDKVAEGKRVHDIDFCFFFAH